MSGHTAISELTGRLTGSLSDKDSAIAPNNQKGTERAKTKI